MKMFCARLAYSDPMQTSGVGKRYMKKARAIQREEKGSTIHGLAL